MKAAVMQPYFMPYIGYFQLIAAVDMFIVYDNIKYTKKGWINRNRILRNGEGVMITLPLQAGSNTLDVAERCFAADFMPGKLLAQLHGAYRTAPFFRATFPLLEEIFSFREKNLFRFNLNSIAKICAHLSIQTPLRVSSSFGIDHQLKAQDKVLALCTAAGADIYVNPIGGIGLYSRQDFAAHGVELRFLRSTPFEYAQLKAPFVPWLSIIDVMMFNPPETLATLLRAGWEYE